MRGQKRDAVAAHLVGSAAASLSQISGGTLRTDVAIVGAGLTGLSAAYHILVRQPGRRVIVLEAEQIGAGASGRSTGMLGPGVGQNLMTLVRRFGPVRAGAVSGKSASCCRRLQPERCRTDRVRTPDDRATDRGTLTGRALSSGDA